MLIHARKQSAGPYSRDAYHAMAELNYLGAEAMARRDAPLSSELYLDAAHAAWYYFSELDENGEHPSPVDELHRGTAEVYNASCEALLRISREKGEPVCFHPSACHCLTGLCMPTFLSPPL